MATKPLTEVSEQHQQKSLSRRIVTGLVCAALYPLIALAGFEHGLLFAIGICIFSVIAASELYGAVRRQGAEPTSILGYAACIFLNLAAWRNGGDFIDPYLPLALAVLVIAGLLIELARNHHHPTANLGTTLLGAIYVGWLSSFVTMLRVSHTGFITVPIAGTSEGAWLVIYVSMMTWGADTAALFVGRQFGRYKIAPAVSPNKTREGSTGGILVACAIGLGGAAVFHIPLIQGVILGILMGAFGLIGDLCASVLKRDLGVKDFGEMLPGHGGVLDRIDSLILTAPVAYYYVTLVAHFR
jgi:phosphatidate cytidylyltransferase